MRKAMRTLPLQPDTPHPTTPGEGRATWHQHNWLLVGAAPDAFDQECNLWRCRVCREERELFRYATPKPTYGGTRPTHHGGSHRDH